jgi:hypothetical protein
MHKIVPLQVGTVLPLPPSPPPPPKACASPKLGSLCGNDAVGAIIGIAVGGALLLALLALVIYYRIFRVG